MFMGRPRLISLVIAAVAIIGAAPSRAAITAYTDRNAFLASLSPDYYLEADMAGKYNVYNGNGFSYVANASNFPFPGPVGASSDLSTQVLGGPITFSFGAGIKAFGGYFYNTSFDNIVVADSILIKLNGDSFTYTPSPSPSSTTSFYGFISDSDLASASVPSSSSSCYDSDANTDSCARYPTVGSVIVGTTGGGPTPAPAPVPLLGAAAAFGASRHLRRRLIAGRPVAGRPVAGRHGA